MGDVVEFRCARTRSEQRDVEVVAERLIAELGVEAGYRIGYLARYAGGGSGSSRRASAVVNAGTAECGSS